MHFSGLLDGNNINLHVCRFLRSGFLKSVSLYLAVLQEQSLMEYMFQYKTELTYYVGSNRDQKMQSLLSFKNSALHLICYLVIIIQMINVL